MKIACAEALAMLAREDVPDEVAAAYDGERPRFGPRYIIPVPFDPRLISEIPPAVAKAAMDSGVSRAPIVDMDAYQARLKARLDPTASSLQIIMNKARQNAKRMIFSEGEQEQVIRAAIAYKDMGLGEPILIGTEKIVRENMAALGIQNRDDIEIRDTRASNKIDEYSQFLFEKLQRQGRLLRDCQRMVSNDRNIFGACAIERGDADAMVTGVTRSYSVTLEEVRQVIDTRADQRVMGISMLIARGGRTVWVSDTNVIDMPSSEELADIATQTAAMSRALLCWLTRLSAILKATARSMCAKPCAF
jgi:malate dehydrogenase (oxaloacetate-decarboxylating)(NADP+)